MRSPSARTRTSFTSTTTSSGKGVRQGPFLNSNQRVRVGQADGFGGYTHNVTHNVTPTLQECVALVGVGDGNMDRRSFLAGGPWRVTSAGRSASQLQAER